MSLDDDIGGVDVPLADYSTWYSVFYALTSRQSTEMASACLISFSTSPSQVAAELHAPRHLGKAGGLLPELLSWDGLESYVARCQG